MGSVDKHLFRVNRELGFEFAPPFECAKGGAASVKVLQSKIQKVGQPAGDALVGYQKFYCVFLADGLMKRFPNFYYEVVIDRFSGVDCADLERAVEGRYVKRAKPKSAMYHCKVKAGDEAESNILQLADLLVGAVGFAWNGGRERESHRAARRREIVDLMEQETKICLSQPTSWSQRKFNI